MEIAIREQAQIAIEEAQLVLFVVDGETGPLPADRDRGRAAAGAEIGSPDREQGGQRQEGTDSGRVLRGLGEPIPVSALGVGGSGICWMP